MIAFLRGMVHSLDGLRLELHAGHTGYEIHVPLKTMAQVRIGQEVELFVHHHFGQEVQRLYGFLTIEERNFFRELTAIKGIGPSLALVILSHTTPGEFLEYCRQGSVTALARIPRIGKKTAERLIFEMKGRDFSRQGSVPGAGQMQLTREALLQLGYRDTEVERALSRIPATEDVARAIALALREL
ncbi:MAG: Holliday junction branch migration protein RuvA [Spirochaetales bacterium]|nr:Holliday junction branch migration protein RuvA [Spirochaetales bacterium]